MYSDPLQWSDRSDDGLLWKSDLDICMNWVAPGLNAEWVWRSRAIMAQPRSLHPIHLRGGGTDKKIYPLTKGKCLGKIGKSKLKISNLFFACSEEGFCVNLAYLRLLPGVPGSFAGNKFWAKNGIGETMAKWCITAQSFICQSWF